MVIVYVINHDGTALIIDTRQHAVTDAVDILEIPVININVHGADIVIAVAPVIKKLFTKPSTEYIVLIFSPVDES